MTEPQTEQNFYAHTAPLSDPGPHREALAALPGDVGDLCRVIHGVMLHRNWANAYQCTLPEERVQDAQARTVNATLDKILALDPRPLDQPREPLDRFAGTCRDFALLLTAILRARDVPARARCGFGRYFKPERYEDHWVCEYWDDASAQWTLTDSQIDGLQRKLLALSFDPLDVPRDQFIVAGEAWRLCHEGNVDPMKFGIFDMHGLWFVRANLLRDFAALNRCEVLPWDDFGMLLEIEQDEEPNDTQQALLDRAADFSRNPGPHFDQILALYKSEASLRVGEKVENWQTMAEEAIPTGE